MGMDELSTAGTQGQMRQGELNKLIARLDRLTHQDHTRDRVCLSCFNRRLMGEYWTHKLGERAVKVGRYVRGKSGQGYFVQRYGMR